MDKFTNQRGAVPIITGLVLFVMSVFGGVGGSKVISPSATPVPSVLSTPSPTVPPQSSVTTLLNCDSSHARLQITGSVPAPTNGDNIWSTLTDEKSGQSIIYGLVGKAGIGGPGSSVDVGAAFTDLAGSIRGQGSLQLFCDGRGYTVKIYSAPFTSAIPSFTNLITQEAVSQNSPVITVSPTPVPSSVPKPSAAPSSGTTNGWSYTNPGGGVTVIPYPFISRQMFYIDFEAATFTDIANIYFNLNYDTSLQGTKRGVETTFIPTPDQIYGHDQDNNFPFIRRQLFLGSCSKGVCTFDPNPIHFHLTVTTTYNDGRKVTEVFTQDNPLHN